MQISAWHDIEAPIDAVFDLLSEYERFERFAIQRGIEVCRANRAAPESGDLTWDTVFTVRGRPRRAQVVLRRFEPPNLMRFEATGKGINGETLIELRALSPRRTRMSVGLSLSANTFRARLLLQSLKLGRERLRRRFQSGLARLSGSIEETYAKWV
ncbi:hypothetical protein AVO45_12305 [Ruegeria marisrubri]|uniref:DNA polymerase III subunit gamma/tau n=1 Tax=Ruegeria marisrubri TaxID=1685379 RepID=A0A0X3TTJ4_9RHOB|nr:SRPBCC family protein [Ruegeria marisrubri]KUJ76560.1 hypothetical protein AVO45_12305 [Ruegeria marisrubri]